MKFLFLIFLSNLLHLVLAGQVQKNGSIVLSIDSSVENKKYWNNWLTNLYEMGVDNVNDTVKINQEVIKIIKDSNYRKTIYPATYSIQSMLELMKKQELKNAFWYMINLYQKADTLSRNIVLRTVLAYESVLEMDKILVSTFYTYSFTDPEVTDFINGKPVITRPDILEKKFNKLKEILNYIYIYRKKNNENLIKKDTISNK